MAPTTDSKGPKAKKAARFKQTTNAGVHKAPKPRRSPDYVHVAPLISTMVSESSTMSQASLPQLPSELKIEIFGSMDSFSTVTTLSCASRTFNSIWKLNAKQICDAVLQRAIECPVEAKALIDAQQSTRQIKDNQSLKGNQKDQNGCQQAVERVQSYLVNMDMASLTLREFEDNGSKVGRRPSPKDRAHFLQAYYRSRVLVLLSTNGIPRSLITLWNMLELRRVQEILECIFVRYNWPLPGKNSALVSEEETERVLGRRNPVSKCEIAIKRMNLLVNDISPILPEIYGPIPRPCRFFVSYDPNSETMDKLRNVPVAAILPLLPEGSLCPAVDLDSLLEELQAW